MPAVRGLWFDNGVLIMDKMTHAMEERADVRRLIEETLSHHDKYEVKMLIQLFGRLVEDHSSVAVMAAHSTSQLDRIADALEGIEKSLNVLTQR